MDNIKVHSKKPVVCIKCIGSDEFITGQFVHWEFTSDTSVSLKIIDHDTKKPRLIKAEDIEGAYLGIPSIKIPPLENNA